MTDERSKKPDVSSAEVSVNWRGLAQFLGWKGSIDELKRVELDRPPVDRPKPTGTNG